MSVGQNSELSNPPLPTELWRELFRDIVQASFYTHMSMVNKAWSTIAWSWSDELHLSSATDSDNNTLESFLQKLVKLASPRKLTGIGRLVNVASSAVWNFSTLTALQIGTITAEFLPHYGRLTTLQELNLGWSKISDADIANLSTLVSLSRLSLCGVSNLTNRGLAYLHTLTNLRRLSIYSADITNGSCAVLANSFPKLEHLGMRSTLHSHIFELAHLSMLTSLSRISLQNTMISLDGMASLAKLTKLTHISLLHTPQSTATIKQLVLLTNLTHLKISQREVVQDLDASYTTLNSLSKLELLTIQALVDPVGPLLSSLAQLSGLHTLSLTSIGFSDAELHQCAEFKSLTRLNLDYSKCGVTPEGFRSFLMRVPGLRNVKICVPSASVESQCAVFAREANVQASIHCTSREGPFD